MAAIICSGIILKKTKLFAGDPAPFVMELPAYHIPAWGNVFRATWERGWSFIKRAGSVILAATVVLWFLQGFGFENGAFGMVEDQDNSVLAAIATKVAWIFAPLGFGNWKATVASVSGLIAKENVVGTFGVLYHFGGEELSENGDEIWSLVAADYTALSAYAFMIFNLLCAPCFAAMGAIKREMNNGKWTAFASVYVRTGLLRCTGGVSAGRPYHRRGALWPVHRGGCCGAGSVHLPDGAPQQVRRQQRSQAGYFPYLIETKVYAV